MSGTLTATVRTNAIRYSANATATQGSTARNRAPKHSAAPSPVHSSAPTNAGMNHGLMMARSIAWNAPTKVRSSVFRSPGMIVCEYRPKTPAISPMVRVAARRAAPRMTSM